MDTIEFEKEVKGGARYEFGRNWQDFLSVLNDERIKVAEQSLLRMLELDTLAGKTFLDIGCGSGLFSLAAMRLGAEKVYSLDYDPQSVACAGELKQRYFADSSNWEIQRGSALDAPYLQSLGQWDIVYSWGVLHHTGDMWAAFKNVAPLAKPGGVLFLAIYPDQGRRSVRWKFGKKVFNSGLPGKVLVTGIALPYWVLRGLAKDLVTFKNPVLRYTQYHQLRGMSRVHDWFDWLGGYPFEVAKPEQVFHFFKEQGYTLERLKTGGCDEFVFKKSDVNKNETLHS